MLTVLNTVHPYSTPLNVTGLDAVIVIDLRLAHVLQLHRIRGKGLARFVVFCPFVYLFVYVSLGVCTDLSSLYLCVSLHGFSRCHPSKAKPEAKTWISGLNLSPLPCKFHSTQSLHYKRHKINKAEINK